MASTAACRREALEAPSYAESLASRPPGERARNRAASQSEYYREGGGQSGEGRVRAERGSRAWWACRLRAAGVSLKWREEPASAGTHARTPSQAQQAATPWPAHSLPPRRSPSNREALQPAAAFSPHAFPFTSRVSPSRPSALHTPRLQGPSFHASAASDWNITSPPYLNGLAAVLHACNQCLELELELLLLPTNARYGATCMCWPLPAKTAALRKPCLRPTTWRIAGAPVRTSCAVSSLTGWMQAALLGFLAVLADGYPTIHARGEP